MNSRSKGKRGELALRDLLLPYWPNATRNLDQHGSDKRDHLHVADLHVQCKRVERLNIWAALDQAITEATDNRLPVLAFRRNWSASSLPSRSLWFGAMELDELLPLLKLREA